MNLAKLNFLLVDDHDFQRRTLRQMLKRLGAEQITDVADGHAALDAFRAAPQPFDICIVDLNMPGMDGMELVRHLAEANCQVSILLISALDRALISSVKTMVKAYGVRLLGAVGKPVTPAALAALLEQHGQRGAAKHGAAAARPVPSREELEQALHLGQFEPWFQPKAELAGGVVRSAEALARWRHPERGLVPPDLFIPLMEDFGLIDALTEQMLHHSALALHGWQARGHEYAVSVNLSLSSLSQSGYAEKLNGILEQQDIPSNRIVFEVTESAAMADLPHSLENLARLRMKGYGLSIDDYGTGYSSMQQLLRIPFSELKMDRSFVTGAANTHARQLVLASGLKLARELHLHSVAEGVETAADWHLLHKLECHYAQGYLIGKPVPAAEFPALVAAWTQFYPTLLW